MLAKRMSLIAESNTSRMRNRASQLKKQGIPVINFAAGELDFDTSEAIKNAAKQSITDGQNKYTDTLGTSRLRELVAKKVSDETNVVYQEDEVGVTAGAKQALFNAAMVLFQEEDEVIIPSPYWGTFVAQIQLTGAKPIILDTTQSAYQIDLLMLKRLITKKTKGIILNTPHNPTGTVYKQEILEKIADLALQHDFWIFFDECYASLIYPPYHHHNIVSINHRVKEKTILINSFSKTYSVTGWRVGYIAAPSKIIKTIKDFQGHTSSNPSSIAQFGIVAALEMDHSEFVEMVKMKLYERLKLATKILDAIPNISYHQPQGAFYLYVNVKEIIGSAYKGRKIDSTTDLAEILLEYCHVAVVPGDAFNDSDAIRISFAIAKEDVHQGLSRMKKLFAEI